MRPRQYLAAATLAAVATMIACNEPPGVNPWRDDSIPPTVYGTASSETVSAANEPPAIRVRDIPPTAAPRAKDAVPHWPLWWEDPFEDQGDNNDYFAWTWQDYFHMAYGPARWALNTVALPASAIVTPPGTPMVSDGVVANTHDAQRGVSPKPVAGFEDFSMELPEAGTELEPLEEYEAPAEAQ